MGLAHTRLVAEDGVERTLADALAEGAEAGDLTFLDLGQWLWSAGVVDLAWLSKRMFRGHLWSSLTG